MPPQRSSSGLMAKLGNKLAAAHEAHKNDETDYGSFGELPAGIQNGVAQLVEAKFDVYQTGDMKGEYYFSATGIVVEPVEHDGIRTLGRRTTIREPMCATPTHSRKTEDEHLAHVYNQLRMLGVDTSAMELDQLEATVQALKEDQPYFTFRTWKGEKATTGPYAGKEPRVQHNWMGRCEYEPSGEAADAVEETAPPPPAAPVRPAAKTTANGKAHATSAPAPAPKAPAKPAATPAPAKTTAKKAVAPPPAPAPAPAQFDERGDLDSLVEQANAGDDPAQQTLAEMALNAGYSQDEVNGAVSWEAVMEMIVSGDGANVAAGEEAATGEEASTEEEETERFVPAKGDVYLYRPVDPKTKKKAAERAQVEIIAVDEAARTVDLKNLTNVKLRHLKVSFDDLEGDES